MIQISVVNPNSEILSFNNFLSWPTFIVCVLQKWEILLIILIIITNLYFVKNTNMIYFQILRCGDFWTVSRTGSEFWRCHLYCQTFLLFWCVCGFRAALVLSQAGHLHPVIRSEGRHGATPSRCQFPSCLLKMVSPSQPVLPHWRSFRSRTAVLVHPPDQRVHLI